MIKVKVQLDSISSAGVRLTTFECTFPRFILAEFNTHRMLSRNAASSRAIPIEKMIQKVQEDPAQIVWWGKNQSGMQAKAELGTLPTEQAKAMWNVAQNNAIQTTKSLSEIGLHKQISNRLLEPFMNITVICTGTEWSNFFALRCHPDAQPEIRRLAFSMLREFYNSVPTKLEYGDWHTPYLTDEEKNLDIELRKKISVAKCARVSYLTHDGQRSYEKDLEMFERLKSSGHMSPFEHVATPYMSPHHQSGNFNGWKQFRKDIEKEINAVSYVPSKKEVEEYFENTI